MTTPNGDVNFLSPQQSVVANGLIADSPEEIRKSVREEVKYGSDRIKLLVTGTAGAVAGALARAAGAGGCYSVTVKDLVCARTS